MNRFLRLTAITALFAVLGGCVVAPAPYGYGYGPAYAYAPAPVYYPPAIGIGIGGCFDCGHFHHWR